MSDTGKETMASFDELMALINKLGNHELVAQVKYSLEVDEITPTPEFCKAAFVGCAYVTELAERGRDAGSLSTLEMVATQEVASLAMSVWATLHEQLVTGTL